MKYVAEIASKFDAQTPSLDWLDSIAHGAAAFLEANSKREGARYLKEARRLARLAQAAIAQGSADGAALAAMAAVQAAWQAELAEGRVLWEPGVTGYRARERVNESTKRESGKARSEWQSAADAIWHKAPQLSAVAVARRIDAERASTIRRHIKKPAPRK
jgi:hypothetical protein